MQASYWPHTLLHVFERGTVTGVRHRDVVLETYVRIFRGTVGHDFILIEDSAWPHTVDLVENLK